MSKDIHNFSVIVQTLCKTQVACTCVTVGTDISSQNTGLHTHTHMHALTHVCTAIIVRKLIYIMHFLAPYPTLITKTKCLTTTLTLTLILTETLF